MRARTAAAATATVVAASTVAVLLGDTLGRTSVLVTAPVVLALALAAVVVATRGVEDLGIGLLVLAVGTATWNGFAVGGLQTAHVALALSLVLLAGNAVGRGRRIVVPPWVGVLGLAVLLVVVTSALWPPAPGYLAQRFEVPVPAAVADAQPAPAVADVLNAVRWSIAALALPVAVCLAAARRPALVGVLASAWALGAGVNAAVALSDDAGLTAISARLLGTVDIGGREAGLTAQPNHLALATALVLPVVVWRVLSSRHRYAWGAVAAVLGGGLILTQSRGGLVAAGIGVLAVLVTRSAGRRFLPALLGVGSVAAALVVATAPERLGRLAETLRLSGARSAEDSDAIRSQIGHQALDDAASSPWHGIGLHVITQGHNIYLQLLAAGGALLLVGFAVAMVGFAVDARALADRADGLAAILATSVAVWLVVGFVENQLTDVFLYIPLALVAGLWASQRVGDPVVPTLVASGSERVA